MTPRDDVTWEARIEDGGVVFRWGRAGDEVVAEWIGVLSLRASERGELLEALPAEGAPADVVDKFRRGVAEAFLRTLRGEHSLHASAVVASGVALVCIGASGSGKSTLAGLLSEHDGVELVADDVTGLTSRANGIHAVPSDRAVWLMCDDGTRKRAVRGKHVARDPAPIARVLSLRFDDALRTPDLRRIRGAEAMARLIGAMMRFEANERVWSRELHLMAKLVEQVEVFDIARPRSTPPAELEALVLAELVWAVAARRETT